MESSPFMFLSRVKNNNFFPKRTLTTFAVKSSIYESSIKYRYNQIPPIFSGRIDVLKTQAENKAFAKTVDAISKAQIVNFLC